jgi:MraZ protein
MVLQSGVKWSRVGFRGEHGHDMFFGTYEHTIDEKGRLTLPARFRRVLEAGVVVARGLDSNVDVYPQDEWDRLVESRLAPLDPLAPETRKLRRFFFAGTTYDTMDRQGRVLVPQQLRDAGGLGRDVVIAGVLDHLEVWSREAWAEQQKGVDGSASDVAQRLANERS